MAGNHIFSFFLELLDGSFIFRISSAVLGSTCACRHRSQCIFMCYELLPTVGYLLQGQCHNARIVIDGRHHGNRNALARRSRANFARILATFFPEGGRYSSSTESRCSFPQDQMRKFVLFLHAVKQLRDRACRRDIHELAEDGSHGRFVASRRKTKCLRLPSKYSHKLMLGSQASANTCARGMIFAFGFRVGVGLAVGPPEPSWFRRGSAASASARACWL